MPTVPGGADAPSLAGERDDEAPAAAHAQGAAESEAEQPALEIAAEFLFDVSRHGPLGGFSRPVPADGVYEFGHEILRLGFGRQHADHEF